MILVGERLALHTTLCLGGPAGSWTTADSEPALIDAARESGEELFILGGGSNVVIADDGFPGAVVKVATRGIERSNEEGRTILSIQAGETWDDVVAFAVARGLAGIECLSGIPGTTGAAPIQNIGAYEQDLEETVVEVRAFDRESDAVAAFEVGECEFGYRTSRFKRNPGRFVILGIALGLRPGGVSRPIRHAELAGRLGVSTGETVPLGAARDAVLSLRKEKGMVLDSGDPDTTSAGSFFLNPLLTTDEFRELARRIESRGGSSFQLLWWKEKDGWIKVSAARLIEMAGFEKGYGTSTVAISGKHALALTHRGGGTTADLVSLAGEIASVVWNSFGVTLVPEPVFVGHDWEPPF